MRRVDRWLRRRRIPLSRDHAPTFPPRYTSLYTNFPYLLHDTTRRDAPTATNLCAGSRCWLAAPVFSQRTAFHLFSRSLALLWLPERLHTVLLRSMKIGTLFHTSLFFYLSSAFSFWAPMLHTVLLHLSSSSSDTRTSCTAQETNTNTHEDSSAVSPHLT